MTDKDLLPEVLRHKQRRKSRVSGSNPCLTAILSSLPVQSIARFISGVDAEWFRIGHAPRHGVLPSGQPPSRCSRPVCSDAALPRSRVSRLVHDSDDFDPLGEDPVEDRERELPHRSAADGRLHGLVQLRPLGDQAEGAVDFLFERASTCGASSRYHCSASARSCTAAEVSRTGGSRSVGEDSLANRFPGHRTLLRQQVLQRCESVTNQVPLPVGHRNPPGARLSQSSTTSSMRSCAGRLSASLWISDLADIVSAYPSHSTTWRHGSGRFIPASHPRLTCPPFNRSNSSGRISGGKEAAGCPPSGTAPSRCSLN